ncbi:PAS domain-containing protein [Mariniblastus sp.]|nr:PAS domain-containing protein [Mariniblastus sp.]
MTEQDRNLIVGIGASAGGLKPIQEFFDHMPVDTGMSFVVVQHLSPDFKSLMDELLARHTKMQIHKVIDGVDIEPNSIYLIPAEKNMSISGNQLLLTDKSERSGLHLPIDNFFQSLAEVVGEKSVAIVLSGTGTDGSRGIKSVREAGGLVLVQTPESAGFDGMPRAAISTGIVDLICNVYDMPDRLCRYVDDFDRHALHQAEFTEESAQAEPVMLRVYRIFRHRNNIDFSLYKPGTISRRLERRMRLSSMEKLDEYIDFVEKDEDEADLLYRDLLVEVTKFFRDPDAFQKLRETIIPELIDNPNSQDEIRAWVCGCATGEEAYSVAMLLDHCIAKSANPQRSFKVFATDVHRKSLEVASNGFYPIASLESVASEFQDKYFLKNNGVCNIRRELRQKVIFAANDLTRDPPFTRLDLVSCRNVLIYLEPKVQKRILSMFHFGLRTKGVLFLGPSETVGDLGNEFEQLDRHWRIYNKRRDVRLPESTRIPLTPPLSSIIHEQPQQYIGPGKQVQSTTWLTTAYEDLLARHVPPSLLVNELNELIHCFGDARKLLTIPDGRPTTDVLKMLGQNLSISVSAALHRAKTEDKPVVYRGVRVNIGDDDQRLFQVSVEPYSKKDQSLYLISLEEMEKVVRDDLIVEDFKAPEHSNDRIDQLERELNYSRETLQATVEELESSNEELQATNEELIASNEELQSTNEELHSVNEELYTVNTEHKVKIEELTEVTSDMDNLLRSTEIGTIFLDRNFNIRMFTPAISVGFNVMEQDIGRPINHISYKLDSPELLTDAAEVLRTGIPAEIEVTSKDNRIYIQRIQPYRIEDRIEGVVLTLNDITELRAAEQVQSTLQSLAEVSHELPDFAYAVSHDLQAPLRHISQYTEIMGQAVEEQNIEGIKKANRVLKTSSSKLRRMIEGLLSYSRINTSGKPLTPVSLQLSLDNALEELETALEADNAKVNVTNKLPEVLGDANQLKVLFYHLIENSVKFRGDDDPIINISCEKSDDKLEVFVEDNGIGIEARHKEDVFTIFKRLGFKAQVPGAGVGLAMCRRIVLRHQGRISIVPTESGVKFGFSLIPPEQISTVSAQLLAPMTKKVQQEK